MNLSLPYGRGYLSVTIPDQEIAGVITNRLSHESPSMDGVSMAKEAMRNPIGTPLLSVLARRKRRMVLLVSDHTRPVPSKVIVPLMLKEMREGNPEAEITILVATGCHRGTTQEELIEKLGQEIVDAEHVVIHDCEDVSQMVYVGDLPSGGACLLNRMAVEADLLVAEGFIEPHFFAGYSGGRKSVLPGVAGRETVHVNHNAAFIQNDCARTGILEGNPIHQDMIYGARMAKLAYIVNVVLNQNKEVIGAFAGDMEQAHLCGCRFLEERALAQPVPAPIVVTTNNGYPLDQNIYQAVKGMTAAEATAMPGGVIIMAAKCEDGVGGDSFLRTFSEDPDPTHILQGFLHTPAEETITDQWQSQIFGRILEKHRVIFISSCPEQVIRNLHMIPADSVEQAIGLAREILSDPGAKITVIPEGVSTIIRRAKSQ